MSFHIQTLLEISKIIFKVFFLDNFSYKSQILNQIILIQYLFFILICSFVFHKNSIHKNSNS